VESSLVVEFWQKALEAYVKAWQGALVIFYAWR
jgi:hypothetical protein